MGTEVLASERRVEVPGPLLDIGQLGESEGAVITRIYPGGVAELAGLRRGDVIVEVDREAVSGGLDAEQKLRKAGDRTLLVIRRGDASFFAALTRPKD